VRSPTIFSVASAGTMFRPIRTYTTRGDVTSTVRARARRAWKAAGLEPLTTHEARHCAVSYFIAAGLNPKEISTYAGHGDVRQMGHRYGHLMPGGEAAAAARLDAFLPRACRTAPHNAPGGP
jgi:integrase